MRMMLGVEVMAR